MGNMARSEKGHVLPLALVIMTVGVIIIGALLHHLNTSLSLASKSEERAITYYAADAGVEDAMWRLLNNQPPPGEGTGLYDLLTEPGQSTTYNITVNGMPVSIVVETREPSAGNETLPETQSGLCLHISKTRDPAWVPAGESAYFTYDIVIYNCGTWEAHLSEIRDRLPLGFTYVNETSTGFTSVEPEITWEEERQELKWVFASPRPQLASEEQGNQTFQALAIPDEGFHYNQAWVKGKAEASEEVTTGEVAVVEASVYDIRAEAGRATIQATVGINYSDEAVVHSWQIE